MNRDYQGLVERVAVDAQGTTWMATTNTLYRIQGGKPEVVASKSDARLALAPGGGVYTWLQRKEPYGRFDVELVETPLNDLAMLQNDHFGFDGLYLGESGRLIATTAPLEDWEGTRGTVEYIFWLRGGQRSGSVTLPERNVGIIAPSGTALLLLGRSEARAFSSTGEELWRLQGGYRKGALAEHAKTVLLNPVEETGIREVHLFVFGRRTVVKMPSPVHHLAISADGSQGAIAVDRGGLFLIETERGKSREVSLPIQGVFFITDLQFVDSTTIALGVIRAVETAPDKFGRFTFATASVLAIAATGAVLFRYDFALEKPATYTPSIDVAYGRKRFSARTPHRVIFVSLEGG